MDERLRDSTRTEWRELGFFYHRNDDAKEWLLRGSREGLLRVAALLRAYVADPRNAVTSEHEHYGPYMYLKVMTWSEAGLDDDSIHGPLEQLHRLASLIEARLERLQPGDVARIREEFAPTSSYSVVLELREDAFDPASADGNLTDGTG